MSLSGKTVVITGSTGGLGKAMTKIFIEEGAEVYGTYLTSGIDVHPDIKDNDKLHFHQVDLLNEDAVQVFIDRIREVDILIHIAGGFDMAEVKVTEWDRWKRMIDINLNACFLICRECLRKMNPEKQGRIIAIGAHAATQRLGGMAGYLAGKAGLHKFVESVAEETLGTRITANCLLPTIMDTPANRLTMPDADFSHWVPVDEVARTALFLAQDSAWHITGASIPVRGHL